MRKLADEDLELETIEMEVLLAVRGGHGGGGGSDGSGEPPSRVPTCAAI